MLIIRTTSAAPDNVAAGARSSFRCSSRVDESKKTGQASIAHTLVLLRVLGQKQQIRLALGPARHGLDHGGVPGLLIDFV